MKTEFPTPSTAVKKKILRLFQEPWIAWKTLGATLKALIGCVFRAMTTTYSGGMTTTYSGGMTTTYSGHDDHLFRA